MSDCPQVFAFMPDYADGKTTAAQADFIRLHLEACTACRNAFALIAETEGELLAWGKRLELANPPAADAREQLAARIASLPVRRRRVLWMRITWMRITWMRISAAALAAGLALMVIAPHRAPPAGNGGRNGEGPSFVGIPYLPPLDPRENAAIVHMDIQVATLIAAGYRVAAEPGAIVPADVLVGEDGRAHAVRMLSNIELKGQGD